MSNVELLKYLNVVFNHNIEKIWPRKKQFQWEKSADAA